MKKKRKLKTENEEKPTEIQISTLRYYICKFVNVDSVGLPILRFCSVLADGTLYEVNTAYDIELSENSFLPRGFLKSLNVFRLVVDDPHLQGFEEGAFQGVIQLKHFDVRSSSVTKVPDFRVILDSVHTIHIDNSRLTALTRATCKICHS
ncbi:uncharacterized protein CEXT_30641 [Caerostris extrusa]|uniref:Uncharacterized protein n=1 Tax=Caerostris extrusa TaxID=172846 RepID=A0AAV4S3B7_CAEEX|nr:uncharacterized protein CEXT_30641 [Caerostris extrusa]